MVWKAYAVGAAAALTVYATPALAGTLEVDLFRVACAETAGGARLLEAVGEGRGWQRLSDEEARTIASSEADAITRSAYSVEPGLVVLAEDLAPSSGAVSLPDGGVFAYAHPARSLCSVWGGSGSADAVEAELKQLLVFSGKLGRPTWRLRSPSRKGLPRTWKSMTWAPRNLPLMIVFDHGPPYSANAYTTLIASEFSGPPAEPR